MKRLLYAVFTLIAVPAFAQHQHSPYTGEENREIRALSPQEVRMYLQGHGMGLAKAAELNHYPGPKHVLELAKQLDLSAAQSAQTQKAYEKMHAEAVRLGQLIVAKEKQLDSLFAAQKTGETELRTSVEAIAKLQGELRFTHLKAHLEMKKVLTPLQVAKYDELRGYGRGTMPKHEKQ